MPSKIKYTNTGVYLRSLYDALVTNLHRSLTAEGYGEITPSHGLVFQYIDDEGSRITQLAFRTNMKKQSMSALVYQLEDLGYLHRQPDPEDARAILFVLTDKGMKLRSLARTINYEFENGWRVAIGTKEYRRLRLALEKLAGLI